MYRKVYFLNKMNTVVIAVHFTVCAVVDQQIIWDNLSRNGARWVKLGFFLKSPPITLSSTSAYSRLSKKRLKKINLHFWGLLWRVVLLRWCGRGWWGPKWSTWLMVEQKIKSRRIWAGKERYENVIKILLNEYKAETENGNCCFLLLLVGKSPCANLNNLLLFCTLTLEVLIHKYFFFHQWQEIKR